MICGKVGSGKTALLQALLGELDKLEGEIVRPNEMIGYCAQGPWLQSMNIRENILFSSLYDEARYKQTLTACALMPDLANFKHGDLSNIGENGVGLSGGQKARIALARAMYSRARILLLDDPISGLDHQTAESVVKNCLTGPMAKDRIIVFVTHRTDLCFLVADQIVEISDGRARILDKQKIPQDLLRPSSQPAAEQQSEKDPEGQEDAAVPEKFIEDEHRASGGVKMRVYWEYIKASGLGWWAVLILIFALYRAVDYGRNWFLKEWGEAYNEVESLDVVSNVFDMFPPPQDNVGPWLWVFFGFALAAAFIWSMQSVVMLILVYSAGRQMFQDIMKRVTQATFRFYDVTPVGRLMNRLTSDIGTIDGNVSRHFQAVAFSLITWISALVVIATVTPGFLLLSVVLTAGYVFMFLRYLPTSQSLRRLEVCVFESRISQR